MIYNLKPLRKLVFGMSLSEANFTSRKFEEGFEAQKRLEFVAKTVVNGYNTAVENGLNDDLRAITKSKTKELSGFFHEGIGMGLYALDIFSIQKKNRFWKYIDEKEKKHEYMSYIGAGLTCGVFNASFKKVIDKGCPMSACLVIDGVGFYYAMFKTKKTLQKFYIPKSIKNNSFYLERYDNGIGRALWFYNSGEPERIQKTISTFSEERRPAIWSGIGLAAAYAGGVSLAKIKRLKELSEKHSLMLGQGVLLAAHTRYTAGNPQKDENTVVILTGATGKECHEIALQHKRVLEGKKQIEGKPSFQFFLENIRNWLQQQEQKQTSLLIQ
jgi:hypothetical protein